MDNAPPVIDPHIIESGEADLALQQRSELMDLPGVVVIGPLPGDTAISSTFSGAVLASSNEPQRAREVLDILGSDAASDIARAKGMRAIGTQD